MSGPWEDYQGTNGPWSDYAKPETTLAGRASAIITPTPTRERPSGIAEGIQRFAKDIGGTIKLGNQQPHGACVSVLLPKECLA